MDNALFRIQARESMGNLHLRLEEIFDGDSALALSALLRERHAECNRLFIATDGLQRVDPFGADLFRSFLRDYCEVSRRVYVKGRNGAHMALEGRRMLRMKPHSTACGCAGRCKACTCAERKKQHEAAVGGEDC